MVFLTPVEVTPGTADAWIDVDGAAFGVPAGATGVILHYVNTSSSGARAVGWRNNGSTDARIQTIALSSHCWAAVGVDASRIFEAYIDTTTDIQVYLVGYFTTDVVFFTNGVDKSLTGLSAWTDVDISGDTGGDTAIGAIVEAVCGTTARAHGFRKNGSTDNRINISGNHDAGVWIIGVDGSEIYERYIVNTNQDDFLLGYIKSNSTFLTNATDLSQTNTAVYEDLPALPSGALGGYIEVDASAAVAFALRKNGSSEDIYRNSVRHTFAIVEADGSQLVEGKIAATTTDFWLVGYPTAVPEAGGQPLIKRIGTIPFLAGSSRQRIF